MRNLCFLLLAATLFGLLGGCAQPLHPQAMVAGPPGALHKSKDDISLAVAGGHNTGPTGLAYISDQDFAEALKESIEKAGLFASVSNAPAARYKLKVFIGQLSQPAVPGFSSTVVLEVSYALVDSQTQQKVWQKNISTGGSDGTPQSATEAAARHNIAKVLQELSDLGLE